MRAIGIFAWQLCWLEKEWALAKNREMVKSLAHALWVFGVLGASSYKGDSTIEKQKLLF